MGCKTQKLAGRFFPWTHALFVVFACGDSDPSNLECSAAQLLVTTNLSTLFLIHTA